MDASILLVSVTSLATYAGVIDDNGQYDRPDVEKSRFLKAQVSSTLSNVSSFCAPYDGCVPVDV